MRQIYPAGMIMRAECARYDRPSLHAHHAAEKYTFSQQANTLIALTYLTLCTSC